jgi:hypothetical protein
MPTAAKLVAAVVFALIAAMAVQAYLPLLHRPDGTTYTMPVPEGVSYAVAVGLGLVIGWQVMGSNTGRSWAEAVSLGWGTVIVLMIAALLALSVTLMIQRSMRMLYKGPMEALLGVFDLMLKYGLVMLDLRFLGLLALGGAAGGVLAEFAGRRWP